MRKIIFIITAFFIAPHISFADTLAQSFMHGSSYDYGYQASMSDGTAPHVWGGATWTATSTYRLSRLELPVQLNANQSVDGYAQLILYDTPTDQYISCGQGCGNVHYLTAKGVSIATSTSVLLSSLTVGSGYWTASTTPFIIPYGVNIISGHTYFWELRHTLGTGNITLLINRQYSGGSNGSLNGWNSYDEANARYMDNLQYNFQTYQSSSAPDSLALTAPYPQTYIQNPITFIGTYHAETICYKEITVDVQSITQAQTLIITPFSFHSCPANPDQTFSFDRTLPYTGQYRARVKLTAFSDADSLPWSPWHEFDLGQVSQNAPFTPQGWTPETCDALDLPCHIRNAFGTTFYPSVTSQETLSSTLSADNLKYRFPLGYVTDFITIISTSTESSLVVVDATLPSVLPGGGSHIRIDLSHILDPVLNATSTIFNNASAPSTQTFYEITSHYWNIILYLAVVFYVIARIVGSHIVPDLGHMNTDTQDMRAKSFSKAEAERYRYKEKLFEMKYGKRSQYDSGRHNITL